MASRKRKVPLEARTLGEAVRLLRTEQRMTLRALAEKVGFSAPFLSDLEHGRRHTNQLDALAEALDVPEEELAKFDPRIPTDVKDWLAENPQLITLLKDLRDSGRPVPLEALRAASKKTR